MKKMNYVYLFIIIFILGVMCGEHIMKTKIVDDCRVLRATRFGEVYIGCGTAQKL